MELKRIKTLHVFQIRFCLNRTIMELKQITPTKSTLRSGRLNRTIMELKPWKTFA